MESFTLHIDHPAVQSASTRRNHRAAVRVCRRLFTRTSHKAAINADDVRNRCLWMGVRHATTYICGPAPAVALSAGTARYFLFPAPRSGGTGAPFCAFSMQSRRGSPTMTKIVRHRVSGSASPRRRPNKPQLIYSEGRVQSEPYAAAIEAASEYNDVGLAPQRFRAATAVRDRLPMPGHCSRRRDSRTTTIHPYHARSPAGGAC